MLIQSHPTKHVSRQWLSKEKDFARAARNAAEKIRNQINDHRNKAG